MRRLLLMCAVTVAMVSGGLIAAPGSSPAGQSPVLVKTATLRIDGTSNVHDYTLSTSTLKVDAMVGDTPTVLVSGALSAFDLQIPLNSFTADKDGLKERMLKAMMADKYPTITFHLTEYAVENGTVKPKGQLTIAGVTKDIDLTLDVKEGPDGVRVHGTRDLSMKDYGIKPPTMMMGVLKTSDKVTITFDLHLILTERKSS